MANLIVFAGNSHPELAKRVAHQLRIDLGAADVDRFSDGEVRVEIHENVRGRDVFMLQSTCAPTNDNLMELMVMADAIKRASASRITAVMPYFGYARQDRRPRSARVPISAKVVADMLAVAGVNRVLTVDLHADQIQGFFNVPVDNVYASPVLLDHALAQKYPNPMVISPDVGGVVRARAIAKRIDDTDLAIIDKRRPLPNESEVMNIIGDVEGTHLHHRRRHRRYRRHAVPGRRGAEGTWRRAAWSPTSRTPCCPARRSSASTTPRSMRLFVTDTIPLSRGAKACARISQLSLDRLLAEAIRRVSNEESVSAMFID